MKILNLLCLLVFLNQNNSVQSFYKPKQKSTVSESQKKEARNKLASLHQDFEKRRMDIDHPKVFKHKHVPTKEDLLNIDHRLSSTMKMLLTEKERTLHSAFLECDLDKYPAMSVMDLEIKTKDDFDTFKGNGDFGIIGIVDSNSENFQEV